VTYSLGSSTQRWKDLWLSGSTLTLGNIVIKNKGLLGGNLNVMLVFKNITLKDWKKINEKKRTKIINLMKKMYS
jgi:hypothetical protein